MQDFFKDWKVHVLCVVIALIAEALGVRKLQITPAVGFSLFPMLYAMAVGIVMGAWKLFSLETMKQASAYTTISVMFLTAKVASGIAPGLYKIYAEGKLGGTALALILQEFGNMGTAILGVPAAVFLFKMGRAAIGCTVSTSREGTIAIIGELYGLDSDEGDRRHGRLCDRYRAGHDFLRADGLSLRPFRPVPSLRAGSRLRRRFCLDDVRLAWRSAS